MDTPVFSIALCDDDPADLRAAETLTRSILAEKGAAFRLRCFSSPRALLDALRADPQQFHMLLLDIMMDSLDGMTLAETLRREKVAARIVFVTSNTELSMAARGYEVQASRYLSKPLQRERLREALEHCYAASFQKKEILVYAEGGHHRISVSDIQYIEVQGRGTVFVSASGRLVTHNKISDLENLSALADFARCHQSFLVNLEQLVSVRRYTAVLRGGVEVPVSKQRYDATRRRLLDYLNQDVR